MAISATYVSSTSFTVDGDQRELFGEGQQLILLQGVDGETDPTPVASVSYSAGPNETTITIEDSVATANLATVLRGRTKGDSVAKHPHPNIPASSLSSSEVAFLQNIPVPVPGSALKGIRVSASEDGWEEFTLIGSSDQLLGTNDAGDEIEQKTIQGTANRTTVQHSVNTITISAPQDLHSEATPTFLQITVTNFTFGSSSGVLVASTGVVSTKLIENVDVHASAAIVESKLSLDYATTTLNTNLSSHTGAANPHSESAASDHSADHIDGGSYPIDGDKIEVTWTGYANFTPSTDPTEVDAADQLTAFFKGIDTALGSSGIPRATVTAGEALSQYELVYLDSSDNGEAKKTRCNGTEEQAEAFGFVTESGGISNGATGEVTPIGEITNGSWSLSAGKIQYVGETPGTIQETRPGGGNYAVEVAKAITSTKLYASIKAGYLVALTTTTTSTSTTTTTTT